MQPQQLTKVDLKLGDDYISRTTKEKNTTTWHTITNHKTDLEQCNTITKRVHQILSELARRDLQLREYRADRDCNINENGSTHSGRHQITPTTDIKLSDCEL
eukprot:319808-Amphidinium_carterae.1